MSEIEVVEERFGWCVRRRGALALARVSTFEQAWHGACWIAVRTPLGQDEPRIVVLTREQLLARLHGGA